MISTWKSFFDLAIFYTYPVFLPPFVSSSLHRLGYLINFFNVICFLRCVLSVLELEKASFEYGFMVTFFFQPMAQSYFFLVQKNSFDKYLDDVNEFIKSTNMNPANQNRGELSALWNKINPKKFQKSYFWLQEVFTVSWLAISTYTMIVMGENLKHNNFPYYSPLFNSGLVCKWLYTVFDTIITYLTVLQHIQVDLVLTVLLSYARCQFLYLKASIDEIFSSQEHQNAKVMKWWIRTHSDAIASVRLLSDLLKPHITIKYVSLVCALAFNLLAFLEPYTNQNLVQKLITVSFHSFLFFIFGYQCNLAENMIAAQKNLYESLYMADVICGKKTESYFFRMLIAMCQRPVRMKGFGNFDMCLKNFKDFGFQLYSFSSSLISIKSQERKIN